VKNKQNFGIDSRGQSLHTHSFQGFESWPGSKIRSPLLPSVWPA